ncbi:MAG: glycosyltransferase [Chitinophagia bacterium]|nr:glycosyltransferase [Chitinophagia bacterium]
MPRLAIVTTHPIQYNAPLFMRLNGLDGIELKVFYTWSQTESGGQYDPDFGRDVRWDVPLLEGYPYVFVPNTARRPGAGRFMGIVNPGIISMIEAWGPDAILVYSWPYHSHLRVLRHFSGKVPILFRGDSTLLNEHPGLRKIARRIFLTWIYRHVDMGLYVGTYNRDYYLAHGMDDRRLCHAPHAVDNERFEGAGMEYEAEATARRRALGIEDDELVVLYVGKIEDVKDPFCIVRISAQVRSPRVRFLFAGNGHLEPDLKRTVAGDGRFGFLGFQNQRSMPVVYRMGDVVILPSRSETWGMAVNEAMACGRPVIVSDRVGCAPDLVEDGRTGWVFRQGAEGERRVAEVLEKLNRNGDMLGKMREACLRRVGTHSLEAAAKGVSKALCDLLKTVKKTDR